MESDDITYIDKVAYRIIERVPVSYPMQETDEERKARGNGPPPIVEFTACRVERADE